MVPTSDDQLACVHLTDLPAGLAPVVCALAIATLLHDDIMRTPGTVSEIIDRIIAQIDRLVSTLESECRRALSGSKYQAASICLVW